MEQAKATARRDKKHLDLGSGASYIINSTLVSGF